MGFSPVGRVARSSSLKMGFQNEVGAQAPLGFWDPLGWLKDADQERFDYLRTREIKHGRIAMLAIVGHLVTGSGVRAPGDIAFNLPYAQMKAGLGAFETIPGWGIAQIIGFIGLLELGYGYQAKNIEEYCKQAMTDAKWSTETQKRKMAIELNNGRAAQMGIFAMVVHEKLDGNPYVLNGLLGLPGFH